MKKPRGNPRGFFVCGSANRGSAGDGAATVGYRTTTSVRRIMCVPVRNS